MLWLRSCPRCTGDLSEQRDIYGSEVMCVQCGYYLNASEETRLRRTHGRAATSRRWRAAQKKTARVRSTISAGAPLKRQAAS